MRKPLYLLCGFICVLLGAIGVLLPLLPTTPFIILAAYCFSKSSEKFHQLLLNHRLFGPMIRDWESYGVIPFKVKLLSTTMMVLMVSYPLLFKQIPWWGVVGALSVVLVALIYVWSRPSVPQTQNCAQSTEQPSA